MISIVIEYETREGAIDRVQLTPEEYFAPIEPAESFESDAIPKYDHASGYLGVSVEALAWTVVTLRGTVQDRTIREDFFPGGRTHLAHRVDHDGREELIHTSRIGDTIDLVTRTEKLPGQPWRVVMNWSYDRLAGNVGDSLLCVADNRE